MIFKFKKKQINCISFITKTIAQMLVILGLTPL